MIARLRPLGCSRVLRRPTCVGSWTTPTRQHPMTPLQMLPNPRHLLEFPQAGMLYLARARRPSLLRHPAHTRDRRHATPSIQLATPLMNRATSGQGSRPAADRLSHRSILQPYTDHRAAAAPFRQRAALRADRSFMFTQSWLAAGLGAGHARSSPTPPGSLALCAYPRRFRRPSVARLHSCCAPPHHHLLGRPSIDLAVCAAALREQQPERSRAGGIPAAAWLSPHDRTLLRLQRA